MICQEDVYHIEERSKILKYVAFRQKHALINVAFVIFTYVKDAQM